MLLERNRIVLGVILKVIFTVLKVIYKILSWLHLQLALLVGIAGIVLWLTGVLKTPIYELIFFMVFGLSIALGAVLTVRKLFGRKDKHKSKDKNRKTL